MQAKSHGLPLSDFNMTSASAPTPTTSYLKCSSPTSSSSSHNHHSTPLIAEMVDKVKILRQRRLF